MKLLDVAEAWLTAHARSSLGHFGGYGIYLNCVAVAGEGGLVAFYRDSRPCCATFSFGFRVRERGASTFHLLGGPDHRPSTVAHP